MPNQSLTNADVLAKLLAERSGQTVAQLAARLVELGRTRAMNPERSTLTSLRCQSALADGPDGRWWSLPAQLEGAVFTVAPTALERHHDILLLRADLTLVARLLRRDRWYRTASGPAVVRLGQALGLPQRWHWDRSRETQVGVEHDGEPWPVGPKRTTVREDLGDALADDLLAFLDELGERRGSDEDALLGLQDDRWHDDVIAGPTGWLPALRPSDMLALWIRDGAVHPTPVRRWSLDAGAERTAIRKAGDVARQLLEAAPGPVPGITLEAILVRLAIDSPEVFSAPLPPFSQILRRAGLDVVDGSVRHPGPARREARWWLDPDPNAPWGYEPGDRAA